MTREEASRLFMITTHRRNGEEYESNNIDEVINKIYDELESRTCENCRYYFMHMANADRMQCKNHNSLMHQRTTTKDFGCNKWEVKNEMP